MSDLELLRRAVGISRAAREHGNHPFGALLADAAGAVLLTAENTVVTSRDVTGHAETNLVRAASPLYSPAELAGFSLYTSCEPCAMCSGAVYWAGIGRVVFAMSEADLAGLTGANPENPTLALPSRQVFAAGHRDIEVLGPLLTEEASAEHGGFWS